MKSTKQSKQNLNDWLQYCESLTVNAIELGLDRLMAILSKQCWHQFTIPVITFAGTNGKGSTIAALEQLLLRLGVRVGVYTSPHLVRYNERIRIAGQEVTDQRLCEAFSAVEAARGDIPLTYFEMGTLAALEVFQGAELDLLLLEVGLGGRLDAVNVVDTDLAVITQIGLDHTEWLGDTREAIAIEKAGIMRPHGMAVFADADPPVTLLEQAATLQVKVVDRSDFGFSFDDIAEDAIGMDDKATSDSIGWRPTTWCWSGLDFAGNPLLIEALPAVQLPVVSVATALQVLALLVPRLPLLSEWREPVRLKRAVAKVALAGRMSYLHPHCCRPHPLLLDIAHNPQSVAYLAKRLRDWRAGSADVDLGNYQGGAVVALFGVLADKSVEQMIGLIQAEIDVWLPLTPTGPRALTASTLRSRLLAAQQLTIDPVALQFDNTDACLLNQPVNSATIEQILTTLNRAVPNLELIVIFGSFYLVGPVLECATSSGTDPHGASQEIS